MKIKNRDYRSVWMEDNKVLMIDQTLLPFEFKIRKLKSVDEVCDAISTMVVRGAPAIGASGCYGMALAELNGEDIDGAYKKLFATRPTAYDLKDGLEYYLKAKGTPKKKADKYADMSAKNCKMIGVHGAKLISDGMKILTHCNAGAIACVDWGTALAPMRVARDQGKRIHVWVDETRPRSQGAKLTAWELVEEGIPHSVIADNAAGYFMASGQVDLVIVGADRIAANDDVANKIGTYEKAVLAKENKIPFYVAAPSTTFDKKCPNGSHIPIEERDPGEVTHVWGLDGSSRLSEVRVTPVSSKAANPAFDVTPAKYITGIITEKGIMKKGRIVKT